MTTADNVAKRRSLCKILGANGVSYHQQVTALTYPPFLG